MRKFNFIIVAIFTLLAYCPINAQMVVGDMIVGQGFSDNAWVDYNVGGVHQGVFIDVNTANCGFTATPHYMVTLEGPSGYHWQVSGTPSIYNTSATGFRVYLRWTDSPQDAPTIGNQNFGNPLTAATAINRQWVIHWTGIQLGACSSCDNSDGFENGPEKGFSNEKSQKRENETVTDEKLERVNKISIFPNPANTSITIKTTKGFSKCEIYNLDGKLQLTSLNRKDIDISNIPVGNYVAKVYSGNEFVVQQFVKAQ